MNEVLAGVLGKHGSLPAGYRPEVLRIYRPHLEQTDSRFCLLLECYNAMDAICAKNTEPALVIATEVNKAAVPFTRAGQRDLVIRAHTIRIFILKQYDGLTGHRGGQAKIRKLDNFSDGRLLREVRWGLRNGFHQSIEAEGMYPLK